MNENIEVWGISAKMGAGKDYVSSHYLIPYLETVNPKKWLIVALADPIKYEVIAKDGMEYERVFETKDGASRRALQHRGTEEGRNKYGSDVWVNWLIAYIRRTAETSGIQRFIVTDVRFPNEITMLRSAFVRTKILRIVAPKRTEARLWQEAAGCLNLTYECLATHPSETALDAWTQFDAVFKNDVDDGEGEKRFQCLMNKLICIE